MRKINGGREPVAGRFGLPIANRPKFDAYAITLFEEADAKTFVEIANS